MKNLDFTEADFDAFESVCRRMSGFSSRVSSEWVDGYLTALAAGWRRVEMPEWLPRMADDAFDRAFADPEDADWARHALLTRAKLLHRQLDPESLLDEPEDLRLNPLVSQWDDEARRVVVEEHGVPPEHAAQMTTGAIWSLGFLDAIEDFAQDWQPPDWAESDARAAFDDCLKQVAVLSLLDSDLAYQDHLQTVWKDQAPSRDDLLDEACFAIQDLRVWWVDHAPRPVTRRVEPTPGRNDACPCGSGLKYKKCHGKAG